MNEKIVHKVRATFAAKFGQDPVLVKAPGRINLIGEHTDYNNGFVLPAAVDQSIYLAVSKSGSNESTLISLDMDETFSFSVDDFQPSATTSWANYIMGVVAEIQKTGLLAEGFQMVFSGDVPRGSGMSSSAALECGTCFALNELFELNISKLEMLKMAQKAEHNYVGVMCGIMDQFASMMGSEDHALKLDCQSLDFEHFPIELSEHIIVLCNSNVSHNLADSEYNIRRQQCEEGVAILKKSYNAVSSLRDVTLEQLNAHKQELSDVVYKRCKYVIEENERVVRMTQALSDADFPTVGEILKVAQEGMREEYEISCPEIDFMAGFANSRQDVLGARMMGGGFGGCTINLVNRGSEDLFISELNSAYQKKFNKEITPIKVKISDGVKRIQA